MLFRNPLSIGNVDSNTCGPGQRRGRNPEYPRHDLGGPFDTEPGAEPASGASVAAPAGPDESAPDEAAFPWLAGRAAPTAA
jgi:hypothetical protein